MKSVKFQPEEALSEKKGYKLCWKIIDDQEREYKLFYD